MQNATEGIQLIPVSNVFYTAPELKALADEGAQAQGCPLVVEWLTLPNDHKEFVVRCKTANCTIEMTVTVHLDYAKGIGEAARRLVVWRPEGQAGVAESDQDLPSLELKTDGKNPTAYIDGSKLTRADLINALINPVVEAARRIKEAAGQQ